MNNSYIVGRRTFRFPSVRVFRKALLQAFIKHCNCCSVRLNLQETPTNYIEHRLPAHLAQDNKMPPVQFTYTDVLRENSVYIGGVFIIGIAYFIYSVSLNDS